MSCYDNMSWHVVWTALRPRVRDHTNRRRGGYKYQKAKKNKEQAEQMGQMIQICGTLARVVEKGLDWIVTCGAMAAK